MVQLVVSFVSGLQWGISQEYSLFRHSDRFDFVFSLRCIDCPYLYFGSANMLVTYFVNFRYLNDHLFRKELFIRFTASAFRKLQSIYVFRYFPFGFEGRMWDLIVSVPDHCLSFYFAYQSSCGCAVWRP